MNSITVSRAGRDRLSDLSLMFDEYRVFYGQPSDRVAAEAFLASRFDLSDSVILIAELNEALVGFTQLYPSFSSVAMQRVWVLNDLYVAQTARRQGVGTRLLNAAVRHAEQTGANRLTLATARDNHAAQTLYESAGWTLDNKFDHYSLAVGAG